MLRDIEKETVDFTPNYDERLKEPVVLPARFPQLLVNGSSGIAVGMATNVPPHNLKEVIDGVIALIDNPDITIEELMEYIKGPDFPTSGVIMGMSGIRSAYTTGRGKIIIRAKAEIEEDGNRQKIIVTEIPYQVNKARLIEKIADLVKDKRLEGISDLRDESDRDGMRIVIELKRDANASIVLNNLYKFTQMQETFGVIMLALVDNKPAILNLKEVLEHYLKFQEDVIVRRTKFDLRKAEARAHILEGLRIALDNIDEIIRVIRSSYNDAKEKLCERFGLSEIQAQAILDMRLARLQGLERDKIDQEYAELEEKIAYYKKILSDEGMVLDIIKDELNEIKDKYGDERRTSISFDYSEIDMEDLIDEEDVVITLTHFGYVKRLKTDTYRAQRRGGRGISGLSTREEDFVEELFVTSTHNYILFFTNMGRMFKLKAYQIPEASRTAKGMAIVNLLELEANEKITATIPLKEFEDGKYLTMVTRKGTIKKTGLMEYNTNRSGGLRAIGLEEDDELIRVKLTDGTRDIIIGTHKGMAIRFNEQDVRPMGRTAHGVRGIKLKDNDYVVGASLVSEGVDLLIVSENGMGKRTNVDEYKVQQRGGKGVKTYKITEKTGDIAGIKTIDDNHDIMLITSDGVVIRTGANEISTLGRDTSGVRLMRLAEDIKVVAIARIDKEEEDVTDDAETELSDGQKEEIAETEE